jgi:CDP-diacylglycerol--glycerol-3-phosphate 3-phosphatidyltransferase
VGAALRPADGHRPQPRPAGSAVAAWVAAVVVARELLVTGLRGIVEATGQKFGADWFGKLKTVLQFAAVGGELALLLLRDRGDGDTAATLEPFQRAILGLMLAATVGSAAQYCVKATRLLGRPS